LATSLSSAELAYLGDAVFELMVREMLLKRGCKFSSINRFAKAYVTAVAQNAMYHAVFDTLTEDEQTHAKRGRNLHTNSRAKSADVNEYRHATGLEALFGYLYDSKMKTRMVEIFDLCIATIDGKEDAHAT